MTGARTADGAGPEAAEADALRARLEAAWRRSDALFATLAPGALHARPIPLRHPFVFYLGHLPAFAWNQIARGVLGWPSLEPAFDDLFERGIDPLDDGAAAAATVAAWPEAGAVVAWRDRVRAAVRESFGPVAARAAAGDPDPLCAGLRVHHLVLEHELMHHETLTYMLQALPLDAKRRPDGWPAPRLGPGRAPVAREIGPGPVRLGVALEDVPFAWDNELGPHEVRVPGFRLDDLPVSVGAFLAFVEAGGYGDPALWDPPGWAWRESHGVTHPAAWRRDGRGWRVRGLFDEHPLEDIAGWPVHVSHAEAAAYARWRGARLPTEPELHRAAYTAPDGGERPFPWGEAPPGPDRASTGWREGGPVPVGSHPAGASAWGVEELVGNGWEWTGTPFAPWPGFRAWARTYPGYSADFFDGEHRVVFGGSWATDDGLLRRSLRNWYRARYPWVFATFRLAHGA